ncbi:putative phage anti-repressor protein [Helicobacter fennelliae]|uniref:Putative phage anti-repressor protein n=1 Tax=Helicobacter fennelliae TaxID=215 RepID=A0A2X3E1R3_9HELI|nr:Rha family transcriptional regulator [Helicobacter fennelliae]SQC36288.1 putative phage anti-repressor protein [Helicobacter fennelliae]
MKTITINKQKVIFENKDNKIFCSSLDIAKVFGKEHKNVLRDIENILKDLQEMGDSFGELNFELTYKETQIKGFSKVEGTIRKDKCYKLSRDAFSLLAMGFTGKEALKWKISFIKTFNRMEEQILVDYEFIQNYLSFINPESSDIAKGIMNSGADILKKHRESITHISINKGENIIHFHTNPKYCYSTSKSQETENLQKKIRRLTLELELYNEILPYEDMLETAKNRLKQSHTQS